MKRRNFIIIQLWFTVTLLEGSASQLVGWAQEKTVETSKEESVKADTSADSDRRVQKVVNIKYADANQVANVLVPFQSRAFSRVSPNNVLRVVTLVDTAETVAKMEEIIKRLDVPSPPPQNIELVAYLLVASDQETAKKLPVDLEGVIKQLQRVFPYSGFRLLDTLMVRCRDGKGGEVSGVAPSTLESVNKNTYNKTFYSFHFGSARIVPTPAGRTVHLEELKLGVKIPTYTTTGNS